MLRCRSMSEPCQCVQYRYGMPMSYQEQCMPAVKYRNFGYFPQKTSLSYNSRAQAGSCPRPCCPNRSDPQEVIQDFAAKNSQQLPQESPRNCNFQPSRNYNFGQQSPRQVPQEARQQFSQQSPPQCFQQSPPQFFQQSPQQFSQQSPQQARQQFPQESCQPFPQGSSRKCYFQLTSQNCGQQSPQNCGQQSQNCFQPNPQNCFQNNFEDDRGRNFPQRCSCSITHEMGVQTDEMDCEVKKDQTPKPEEPKKTEEIPEESKDLVEPDIIEVTEFTTKEMEVNHRTGEKEIILSEVQSVTHFPIDGTKAFTETQTRSKITQVSGSGTNLRQETQSKKTVRAKTKKEAVIPHRVLRESELEPIMESLKEQSGNRSASSVAEELVYQEYEAFESDFKNPNEPQLTSYHSPISQSPVEHMSRSESGKDMSLEDRTSHSNNSVEQDDEKSTNSEVKLVEKPTVIKGKRRKKSSELSNVSTVHVRVTNRKEASVMRPNASRDSQRNLTSVFQSRVEQMIVKKRKEKKPEVKKPEEKKPEEKKPEEKTPEEKKPEPKEPEKRIPEQRKPEEKPKKKKPQEKKPKRKLFQQTEMKHGYPSDDLVCRYANPPKCRPNTSFFRCPRPPSSCCRQCPSSPPKPIQYDPIYGFGSKVIAYYRC
ncbi:muscle M-line assembly protein unc-89 isoform X2 [Drosophila rhopaloa]|uniref:Uncharacterized protein n=1 Tax=Drosophila rhopaloa TaxID=1041015 RepID=A0ABM5JEP3_DRORH|nr:muscle M-line assembly protein unc-89 isoform X2 [Drosophila rhopaloa]